MNASPHQQIPAHLSARGVGQRFVDAELVKSDRLQTEIPIPKEPDPNAAAALQELLGGKYGEMSTLGNYMFQSFNFRSKSKLRPFYSLVANITAEELGHVELVSNGVASTTGRPMKMTPKTVATFQARLTKNSRTFDLPHHSYRMPAAPCR